MNLSQLLTFLNRIDRRPNKRLSQNFLIDQNVGEKIVRTAAPVAGEIVLEIGPGPGALTSLLLEKGARVVAVEKDPVLAKELTRLQTPDGRLTVISDDFLTFDFSPLKPHRNIKVIGNLPYHITTPILEKLFDARELFSTFTIMIQSEVATRMMASCGSKMFSSLSLFVQFHTQVNHAFKVSPSCFYPRPKVESTVLQLELKPPPLEATTHFFSIVRRAFQQRRKMILSSLQSLYRKELLDKALDAAGIKWNARPEELSLAEWLLFVTQVCQKSC